MNLLGKGIILVRYGIAGGVGRKAEMHRAIADVDVGMMIGCFGQLADLEDQRQRFPQLLNGVGKLEVATGAFAAAQRDFQDAAALTPDQRARAEAHYNAYGAALEQNDWPAAHSTTS